MESFVKYIEYHLLEKREKLSTIEVNEVVQFNIKRKQLIEQLIALLTKEDIVLGDIFKKITENIGMHIFISEEDKVDQCWITKDICSNGRIICLCESIDKSQMKTGSFQFYCRSDVVKYLRFFYFVQHFNFYVMMRIYETKVEERWGEKKEYFMNDLQKKFHVSFEFLKELVRPLEFNCEEIRTTP